jgi:hypothetical protein
VVVALEVILHLLPVKILVVARLLKLLLLCPLVLIR